MLYFHAVGSKPAITNNQMSERVQQSGMNMCQRERNSREVSSNGWNERVQWSDSDRWRTVSQTAAVVAGNSFITYTTHLLSSTVCLHTCRSATVNLVFTTYFKNFFLTSALWLTTRLTPSTAPLILKLLRMVLYKYYYYYYKYYCHYSTGRQATSPTSSYCANTVNVYHAAVYHRYFNMTKQRYVMEWSDRYSQLHFADFHAPRLCHLINVDLQSSTAASSVTQRCKLNSANSTRCMAWHHHICQIMSDINWHLQSSDTFMCVVLSAKTHPYDM